MEYFRCTFLIALITVKGISCQVVIFTGRYGGREYLMGNFLIAEDAIKTSKAWMDPSKAKLKIHKPKAQQSSRLH